MKKFNKLGKSLLLADYSNILYKYIHVNARLTHKGKFTGGAYGFINELLKAIKEHSSDYLVVCKDSKPYVRKEIYSEYKGNRKQDEIFVMKLAESKKWVDQFLNIMNFKDEEIKGYEADDLIAQYCKSYSILFDKIVIKSNDDDLFQLLKNKIILDRGKKGIYTLDNFTSQYGIHPLKWIDVIALAGSHNNVEGIRRVGPKTALKIVKDKDLFDGYYEDYRDMIERNRNLIRLPYKKLPIKALTNINKVNVKELRLFLAELGITLSVDGVIDTTKGLYER